jgi:hypothetical protein
LAEQAGIESEAVEPVEAALQRALELSENDGSIVLSAGSMFVTGEVMTAWDKMEKESGIGNDPILKKKSDFPNHK